MNIFILDCSKMTSIKEAHDYMAHIMRFPDYYGNNLDALYDCLSEFSDDTTIILMNTEIIYDLLGEYGGRLLSVFAEVADEEYSYHLIRQH